MARYAIIMLMLATALLAACSDKQPSNQQSSASSSEQANQAEQAPGVGSKTQNTETENTQPSVTRQQKENNSIMIEIQTNKGNITVELNAEKAPITVENFLAYVDANHYDGTVFHRVIEDFMIQGGGFTTEMNQKATNPPIKNEATNGLSNDRGTIAMARTNIVDSATCQFFINVKDNPFLNHRNQSAQGYGYCVFGKVVQGMEVVDAIKTVPTGYIAGMENVPVEPIIIKTVVRK